MELTITQNGALYFAHRKVKASKHRAALFRPLYTRASKQDGQDIRRLKISRSVEPKKASPNLGDSSGDKTGSNVIETHYHKGEFRDWAVLRDLS